MKLCLLYLIYNYCLYHIIAGTGFGSFSIYGSSTANVSSLPTLSNVEVPGMWLYQIGKSSPGQGGEITPAELVNGSSKSYLKINWQSSQF